MNSNKSLIEVKNLSKEYNLNGEIFKALDNVSFTLYENESIGLIGKNGSGKSTLLKILAGLIKPSAGEVIINGKINSLIEIGSNFIADLTGRENVKQFLRINGIKPNQIEFKILEIEKLSELGDFFDQPVKFYSSGMFVRLAISAGFYIDADIFLIDEVLMAGDVEFRGRINHKFEQSIANGASIILASHNPEEVRRICKKSIWLEKGNINAFENTDNVLELYQNASAKEVSEKDYKKNIPQPLYTVNNFDEIEEKEKFNKKIVLENIEIIPIHKDICISYENGFQINIRYKSLLKGKKIHPLLKIYDIELNPILILVSSNEQEAYNKLNQIEEKSVSINCTFPKNILSSGIYYLEFVAGENPILNQIYTKEVFKLNYKIKFIVKGINFDYVGASQNLYVKPKCKWDIY